MSSGTLLAPLILASQSPRRQEILRWAELPFTVVLRPVEETYPPGTPTLAVAEHIARKKAEPFDDCCASHIVLTCDTVVLLGNHVLGKPTTEADAVQMLQQLSGKTHTVASGVAIRHGSLFHSFTETTEVAFRDLPLTAIQHYVQAYQPLDKAGAYGVQDYIGLRGVKGLRGDFYNVMGLPLCRLVQELEQLGLLQY
jgi:septum formation protein